MRNALEAAGAKDLRGEFVRQDKRIYVDMLKDPILPGRDVTPVARRGSIQRTRNSRDPYVPKDIRMTFSQEGYIGISPSDLLARARCDLRSLVNDILLAGTPYIFGTSYSSYCEFRRALAERLHVHPCSIVIRGSARLGYSTKPVMNEAWRALSDASDIDVAIADADYFNHLDSEIQSWESRQLVPHFRAPAYYPYARRETYRAFNCVADEWLPPNTCVWHTDVMENFDTASYLGGVNRDVSAFVFRDWWSLRNRWEFDLRELCRAVDENKVGLPPE